MDFSYYKHGTVKRRVPAGCFWKIDTLEAYLQYLRKNPDEERPCSMTSSINASRDFSAIRSLRCAQASGFRAYWTTRIPPLNSDLGARLSDWRGGIFSRCRSSNILEKGQPIFWLQIFATDVSGSDHCALSRRYLSGKHRNGYEFGTSSPSLPEGGRRLSDQQDHSGHVRLRQTGSDEGSAVLENPQDQLQERDDLYGTGPATKNHSVVPLMR